MKDGIATSILQTFQCRPWVFLPWGPMEGAMTEMNVPKAIEK